MIVCKFIIRHRAFGCQKDEGNITIIHWVYIPSELFFWGAIGQILVESDTFWWFNEHDSISFPLCQKPLPEYFKVGIQAWLPWGKMSLLWLLYQPPIRHNYPNLKLEYLKFKDNNNF
jgi:hypothetical protein